MGLLKLWGICDNQYSGTDGVIKLRKDQLQDEGELEKIKKKRRLDFLDILLFARVSVYHRGAYITESLPGNTQQGTSTALMTPVVSLRQRMGIACLTRTSVLRWTHSCSRAMTPQPADCLGSSMLWPHTLNTNRDAGKKFRVSWEMDPPSPGKSSRGGRTLILWVGRSLRSPVYLNFRMDLISGITLTRCPIPPCASRRP